MEADRGQVCNVAEARCTRRSDSLLFTEALSVDGRVCCRRKRSVFVGATLSSLQRLTQSTMGGSAGGGVDASRGVGGSAGRWFDSIDILPSIELVEVNRTR